MKKIKISSYFLFLSLFTLATIFIFIVQVSYSKLMGPLEQLQTSSIIKPLDPNLDVDIINQIKNRQEFSPQQLVSPTPTNTPTPL